MLPANRNLQFPTCTPSCYHTRRFHSFYWFCLFYPTLSSYTCFHLLSPSYFHSRQHAEITAGSTWSPLELLHTSKPIFFNEDIPLSHQYRTTCKLLSLRHFPQQVALSHALLRGKFCCKGNLPSSSWANSCKQPTWGRCSSPHTRGQNCLHGLPRVFLQTTYR